MITTITLGIVAVTSLALFGYGLNLIYLTWRATRLKPRHHPFVAAGSEPNVCVQLPIYNERYVAERVIDAVCAMDWPRDRFEVQVLDDSDDETSAIVSRRVARWRHQGVRVSNVMRGTRQGYKAGALAHGLSLTKAPFIAIFDADFVPPRDFLRRMIGAFENPQVAFAQARWGHLDEGYSWFTRLQALVVDFHFLVEQAVRSSRGYFTNFTGTAGVWRRAAIEDAGGWSAATLTEDLDLSYRAQLRGWRSAYLEDVIVPEELPVSIDAYRRQQSRWATGSFQCAFSLGQGRGRNPPPCIRGRASNAHPGGVLPPAAGDRQPLSTSLAARLRIDAGDPGRDYALDLLHGCPDAARAVVVVRRPFDFVSGRRGRYVAEHTDRPGARHPTRW